MNVDEFLKDLEMCSLRNGGSLGWHSGLIDNAITVIEQQRDEIVQLRASHVTLNSIIEQVKDPHLDGKLVRLVFENCTLKDELKRLQQ